MDKTAEPLEDFLARVTPAKRRTDAQTLVGLMSKITRQEPILWGTIIGFGRYHYKYNSGREGVAPAAGFAPRKAATTIYLPDGVGSHQAGIERLGPHTTGVGCVYIKDLSSVDLGVLEAIISASFRTVTDGTYGLRAREGTERERS